MLPVLQNFENFQVCFTTCRKHFHIQLAYLVTINGPQFHSFCCKFVQNQEKNVSLMYDFIIVSLTVWFYGRVIFFGGTYLFGVGGLASAIWRRRFGVCMFWRSCVLAFVCFGVQVFWRSYVLAYMYETFSPNRTCGFSFLGALAPIRGLALIRGLAPIRGPCAH